LSRKQAGRGVNSILDMFYTRLINLAHHLRERARVNRYLAEVVAHEEQRLLRYTDELISAVGIPPPNPGMENQYLSAAVKSRLQAGHVRAWTEKTMHGYSKREAEKMTSRDAVVSNGWTRSLKLTSHLEGYLCAIQEQEIETRHLQQMRASNPDQINSLCRYCKTKPESITHIVGSCSALSASLYLPIRHDAVAKTLYNSIIRIEKPEHAYVNPQQVMHVGPLELWWDTKIATTPSTEYNKPDIVMWNHATKECKVIEVSVPLDCNVAKVEVEKRNKYVPLIVGLKRIYPLFAFEAISVVLGATGLVTQSIKDQIGKIGFEDKDATTLVTRLQEKAVLGTIKIVKAAMALKK
jgi:hypothetical protein